MNRREFTRNMLAAAAAPAVPLPSFATPAPAIVVPKAARFWAIYMTHLHGDVTPGMLTQMTGIDPVKTTAIRNKLIADNVIAPTGFVQKSVASQTVMQSEKKIEATLERLKQQTGQAANATEHSGDLGTPSENADETQDCVEEAPQEQALASAPDDADTSAEDPKADPECPESSSPQI